MEENTKPDIKISEVAVQRNFDRLRKIQVLLGSRKDLKIADIKKEVKGTARLYNILTAEGIVYKGEKGYEWKDSIPTTLRLAKTITTMIARQNKAYSNRTKPEPKQEKDTSSESKLPFKYTPSYKHECEECGRFFTERGLKIHKTRVHGRYAPLSTPVAPVIPTPEPSTIKCFRCGDMYLPSIGNTLLCVSCLQEVEETDFKKLDSFVSVEGQKYRVPKEVEYFIKGLNNQIENLSNNVKGKDREMERLKTSAEKLVKIQIGNVWYDVNKDVFLYLKTLQAQLSEREKELEKLRISDKYSYENLRKIFGKPLSEHPYFAGKDMGSVSTEDMKEVFEPMDEKELLLSKLKDLSEDKMFIASLKTLFNDIFRGTIRKRKREKFEISILWGAFRKTIKK